MSRRLAIVVVTVFLLVVWACSKQTPSKNGQPNMSSISLNSDIAGMVLIDGEEIGKRIKAQGTVLIDNIETGLTETAAQMDDGTVVKAAEQVLVKAGETVTVHIAASASVTAQQPAVVQADETTPVKAVESPKQETKTAQQPAAASKPAELPKQDPKTTPQQVAAPKPVEPPKQEQKLTLSDKERADQLFKDGEAYYDRREYDKALTAFSEAFSLNPNNAYKVGKYASAYNNRGNEYIDKRNYDLAIADLTAAIRIESDNDWYLINRGIAYREKGDYDNAITDFTVALRIKPDYDYILIHRGVAYYYKNDFDRAIADWEAVLRINPNNADARRYIESARQRRGY